MGAAQGIRINAIGSGYTKTPPGAALDDDPGYGDAIEHLSPQFQWGVPAERLPGTYTR
jgi:NAD(P)-dependent dehydrogenase (short-subunit alcohol dehydrogenase family)